MNLKNVDITVYPKAKTWEDAIKLAAQPLLDKGYITAKYVDSMIDNVKKNGSYIVIMPYIALPHSKYLAGVMETSISILKLNEEVDFPDKQPAKLIICLAAKDNSEHLNFLSALADVFMSTEKTKLLLNAKTTEELRELLNV